MTAALPPQFGYCPLSGQLRHRLPACLAMATFLELGSVWNLPRFEWYTLRVHRQLARTPGLVGYSFRAEFPLRYWTISAWENGRALHGFVRAGTHRSVMAALPATMRRFRHTHWKVTGSGLPLAWADALHLSGNKRNVLPWIGAAFVLYLIAVVITMAVNVPLNDALKAAGDPARIGDLAAVRRHFGEAKWSAWNLVRTVTSTAAFGCLIAAAMLHRSAK